MFGFSSSGFFPVAVNFLRRVPVLGTLLNLPVISGVSKFSGFYDIRLWIFITLKFFYIPLRCIEILYFK